MSFDGRPASPDDVCAVVVTYHPDAGLAGRLETVLSQVPRLVLVDNGSGDSPALRAVKRLERFPRVRLVANESNAGLARGFNQGIRAAAEEGHRFALLLDQDSAPEPTLVETLVETWNAVPQPPAVAVVGANYLQGDGGVPFAAPGSLADWTERSTVISSGSLVSLATCARIGGMREDLFIDYVDHEFCLRARAAGERVVLTGPPVLTHSIGEVARRRVAGRSVGSTGHSPDRRYYQARNQVAVLRRYALREPGWAAGDLLAALRSLAQMTLTEADRGAKWRAVAAGVIDGLRGRGGPR